MKYSIKQYGITYSMETERNDMSFSDSVKIFLKLLVVCGYSESSVDDVMNKLQYSGDLEYEKDYDI